MSTNTSARAKLWSVRAKCGCGRSARDAIGWRTHRDANGLGIEYTLRLASADAGYKLEVTYYTQLQQSTLGGVLNVDGTVDEVERDCLRIDHARGV